ncbi:MAG: S46 family peptidase [Bacteroidetes bacterium]|nr:MAG: S46 family peptidase [Bacteroidota bacterium]
MDASTVPALLMPSSRLRPAVLAVLLVLVGVLPGCSGAERSTARVVPERAVISEAPAPITEAPSGQAAAAVLDLPSLEELVPKPRLDTVQARPFDTGRMWTFEYPPLDYFEQAYGFRPDSAWLNRARLAALRIPGCSASFVSSHGLMLTNHHCGRGYLPALSGPEENLLEDGFLATTLAEERPVAGLYAEQLVAITDVTAEVAEVLDAAETAAERSAALDSVEAALAERLLAPYGGPEAGYRLQLITLYHGGRYSAYTFRRYDDVRLVFAPELQLGYFGGDPDNFTYPRYNLDMMLFRVYEDGRPLSSPHYFPWSNRGVREGDAVFVIGNPGTTYRLETMAQLRYRAAVREPALLRFYRTRREALTRVYEQTGEEAVRNMAFSLSNGEKAYEGFVKTLQDPYIMARLEDGERRFRAALAADSALQARYGDLHEHMAEIQQEKTALGQAYGAFLLLQPGTPYGAVLMQRALLAWQWLTRQEEGASAEALDALRTSLLALEDRDPALEQAFVALRLEDLRHYLGAGHPAVRGLLEGRSPSEAAADLLASSVLATQDGLAAALEAGTLARTDPAIRVIDALQPAYRDFQSAQAGLAAEEAELARRLGQARFAVYGTAIPPDATFSLRLADGVVKSYPYNGTVAPAFTTFDGLYDRYYAHGGAGTPWDLPERWLDPPATFDRTTPYNFVSTNDIVGGNSGSPVVNRALELVGVAFDGNIESLSGRYIFRTDGPRAVSVDARGMLEALDEIYEADRLVIELMTGAVPEAEADPSSRP